MREPDDPEPLRWQPEPTLRERIWRACSAPAAVGTALFLVVVVAAIALVAFRPHGVDGVTGDGSPSVSIASGVEPGSTTPEGAATREIAASSGSGAGTEVVVHVTGMVLAPGVVSLPAGARVADAIEAAGGAAEGAGLSGVNLARVVKDGEQIVVPSQAQVDSGQVLGAGGSGGAGAADGLVNLNLADRSALETLPRVGPALAGRIIDWREANGPFVSVEQLLEVSGVGAKTFAELSALVTV